MSEKLPATIYAEQVPGKGTGLFTSKAIDAGEPVFRIERPLACVPDNEHLAETCYNCFLWIPPEDRSEDDTTLKTCSGCKAAKYCSKVSEDSYCVMSLRSYTGWQMRFSQLSCMGMASA